MFTSPPHHHASHHHDYPYIHPITQFQKYYSSKKEMINEEDKGIAYASHLPIIRPLLYPLQQSSCSRSEGMNKNLKERELQDIL